MQGMQVQSLVGELKSHISCGQNTKQRRYCNKLNKDFKNSPRQKSLYKQKNRENFVSLESYLHPPFYWIVMTIQWGQYLALLFTGKKLGEQRHGRTCPRPQSSSLKSDLLHSPVSRVSGFPCVTISRATRLTMGACPPDCLCLNPDTYPFLCGLLLKHCMPQFHVQKGNNNHSLNIKRLRRIKGYCVQRTQNCGWHKRPAQ